MHVWILNLGEFDTHKKEVIVKIALAALWKGVYSKKMIYLSWEHILFI